ncbi:MAG: PilZ domain-containing protein, partial [Desulfobaccales bacterium]
LSETGAQVISAGDLVEWEDVRLHLFEPDGTPIPGKIYGKVTQVQPGANGSLTATIRFTSVSPETYRIIRQAVNKAAAE